jgi:DNA gyrase subunit A
MEILEEDHDVLVVTKNGYGKRTPAADYRVQSRGGKGLITCHITEKTGSVVAVETVKGDEDLMLITAGGILIRMSVKDISVMGRNTQGVILIRLDEDEYVATVAKVEKSEGIEEISTTPSDEEITGEERYDNN